MNSLEAVFYGTTNVIKPPSIVHVFSTAWRSTVLSCNIYVPLTVLHSIFTRKAGNARKHEKKEKEASPRAVLHGVLNKKNRKVKEKRISIKLIVALFLPNKLHFWSQSLKYSSEIRLCSHPLWQKCINRLTCRQSCLFFLVLVGTALQFNIVSARLRCAK